LRFNVLSKFIEIGVDEAGRGSLISDLVVSLIAISEDKLDILRKIGVKDSKQLSPRKRSELAYHIVSLSNIAIVSYISPPYIDKAVSSNGLNMLEAIVIMNMFKSIKPLLETLDMFIKIYMDEVKGYYRFIEGFLKKHFRDKLVLFVMESKADKKYPVVSAASVVAKYFRDTNLSFIKNVFGNFGSGYPSDPRTRDWIINNYSSYRNPLRIIRRSWSTLKKIAPDWSRGLRIYKITDYF